MKLLVAVTVAISVMLYSAICLAEGFKVDISTMEAVKHFNVLSIGSLAVGETGLVKMFGLRTCIDNGELKISSITKLDTKPTGYFFVYEVTRNPNDELSVILSKKGKNPDSEAVQESVFSILSSTDCQEIKDQGVPLFTIKSFLGSSSLSELITTSGAYSEKSTSESLANSVSRGVSKDLNDWVVMESKSPIDDSPGVTLMKKAVVGNQALVIRCKEDKTVAYIMTDDFLGEQSTSVIVRYDEKKAEKQYFSLSTDNRTLFFRPAISNIKKMMRANKIVIRFNINSGTPKKVIFKLDGLSEKINPLRKACHW